MDFGWITHPISFGLQLLAAILAIRLIPFSGRSPAWLLFSAAFMLMGVRCLLETLQHAGILEQGAFVIDIAASLISILLIGGLIQIRAFFIQHQVVQQKLEKQLDELQRFQKVALGRELRMRELYEENEALKAGLGEQGK